MSANDPCVFVLMDYMCLCNNVIRNSVKKYIKNKLHINFALIPPPYFTCVLCFVWIVCLVCKTLFKGSVHVNYKLMFYVWL